MLSCGARQTTNLAYGSLYKMTYPAVNTKFVYCVMQKLLSVSQILRYYTNCVLLLRTQFLSFWGEQTMGWYWAVKMVVLYCIDMTDRRDWYCHNTGICSMQSTVEGAVVLVLPWVMMVVLWAAEKIIRFVICLLAQPLHWELLVSSVYCYYKHECSWV